MLCTRLRFRHVSLFYYYGISLYTACMCAHWSVCVCVCVCVCDPAAAELPSPILQRRLADRVSLSVLMSLYLSHFAHVVRCPVFSLLYVTSSISVHSHLFVSVSRSLSLSSLSLSLSLSLSVFLCLCPCYLSISAVSALLFLYLCASHQHFYFQG